MVGQADAVACGVATVGLTVAGGSVVGVGVADAVNVGGGAVAVWVVVTVGVWLAVGIDVWLGTAVGSAAVGVVDASTRATWAGTAANCGGREQPEMNSISIMNKPFSL